ncbi:MAG: acetyltransferase, partial [Coprobacter sp.]|nr:acetyltransferase [Coprobacter sp.]
MNRYLENILYFPLYLFIWLHSLLPFWVLYILSDILFLLVYYVVGYRRKVVFGNMRNSFPDRGEKEIHRMERAFYR